MADEALLNEISLNRREITHPEWGSFIIKRPTNKVLSEVETARTRSYNTDLQSRVKVYDPEKGEDVYKPAFLTRRRKAEILRDMGEWTQEDEDKMQTAQKEYRDACFALEDAGFEGTQELFDAYTNAAKDLKDLLEEKAEFENLEEDFKTVFPVAETNDYSTEDMPEVDYDKYYKSRKKIEKATKSLEVMEALNIIDRFHKQYKLMLDGLEAQTKLYLMKVREISLFSDTVEARAEKSANVVKVYECSRSLDGTPVWESLGKCEDDDPRKVGYLLDEIEKFERLDASSTEETEKRRYKFNFLFPLQVTKEKSEGLDDQPESNPDGDQQAESTETSTEDSETAKVS